MKRAVVFVVFFAILESLSPASIGASAAPNLLPSPQTPSLILPPTRSATSRVPMHFTRLAMNRKSPSAATSRPTTPAEVMKVSA